MTAIAPMGSDPQKTARERTEKWLEGVYQQELGRDLGDEGRKYWADDIHERGQTREEVIANIRRSPEYDGYNRGKEENSITLPEVPKPPKPERPRRPYPERPRRPNPDRDNYNDRKYGIYDAISAASSAGNRMTDDYYQRFLPEMRNSVHLGINEIGAADRFHGDRYEGSPPEYLDPEDLFKKYGNNSDIGIDDGDGESDLEKRIKALEDKYRVD